MAVGLRLNGYVHGIETKDPVNLELLSDFKRFVWVFLKEINYFYIPSPFMIGL